MKDDKRLKRKVRNSYIVSTVSITLVLFLLGSVGYLMVAALKVADTLQESIAVSVELKNGLSDEQREAIEKRLTDEEMVATIAYSPKEEKIDDQEFRKMFNSSFEEILQENPLLDSFELTLTSASADKELLDSFIAAVGRIDGVDRVSYPAQMAERLHATVNKIRLVLLMFGGALLVISLILLSNKIRPEAPQTFSYFAQQGVRTKVISGDNPLTVSEVARRAGIPDAEKFVDARTLKTDAELAKAAEDMTVFGRVTPDQKKKLVAAMKRAGHTVAMTGDGVNDVLALREADCSIAMASGSGVACQASHIVLLDSQFSALPSVVAEGRRVINNIERSASLYLVKNIFTFVLSLITLFFTLPYPYTPAQLSLVNALTIGIPSFILAMEPNENRISGRFLPNVIYRALPAALSDLILVVGVMLFYLAFHIKEDMLSTLCTGIMGIVGLLMIHQTSLPLNKLRKAMLIGLCAAFVVCYFFLPELFTLSALDNPSLLILVVLGLLAFSVMFVCRRGLRKVKARLNKGIFPRRKKR